MCEYFNLKYLCLLLHYTLFNRQTFVVFVTKKVLWQNALFLYIHVTCIHVFKETNFCVINFLHLQHIIMPLLKSRLQHARDYFDAITPACLTLRI